MPPLIPLIPVINADDTGVLQNLEEQTPSQQKPIVAADFKKKKKKKKSTECVCVCVRERERERERQ